MNRNTDEDHPAIGADHDPETDTYHALYDTDAPGSLCGAVIYLVSVAIGKEPEAMDPLSEIIDPDALEAVFRPGSGADVRVGFEFCGCHVTAIGNGEVQITPSVQR